MRIGPQHPRFGRAVFRATLPLLDRLYASRSVFRLNSAFAQRRLQALQSKLASGSTVYLAGICAAGTHNSGVSLIEASRDGGPRILCNNEEERFSGKRYTTAFPRCSITALKSLMQRVGVRPEEIDGWFSAWDSAVFGAMLLRTFAEEAPWTFTQSGINEVQAFNVGEALQTVNLARRLGREMGCSTPIIGIPHHDCHAWFSFCASPFTRSERPVMISVIDGTGDRGAISLYVCEGGAMRQVYCNDSFVDSLGSYYSIVSSTQGGWTMLSSEGRYMGAAAWGDLDRKTNPFYSALRQIFVLAPDGQVYLNRSLANWGRSYTKPYTKELVRILGKPIAPKDMWNPDAVLRIEDIKHKPDTQERLDKAAATQLVFEDALIHIIDHLIRKTGSDQLVLTGGTALNAVGNMRLLEHFDEAYYRRQFGRRARLHLWAPPTPSDAGVAMGAAFMGAYLAGAPAGKGLDHAFYCGSPPSDAEILDALRGASDIAWIPIGDASESGGREALADLMAYVTAKDGVVALFQGAAETGPRALGHRSILANPCNPRTRDVLNARVKFREAYRPLAPMATLDAARRLFELSEGGSDDDYSAYSYMVLTAPAKPEARAMVPAVIHADGTARLQIVRERADPLTYAYLKALGRRIGVEAAVNTSFNVGGPIAQTPLQALETVRRAKGLDVLVIIADEGPAYGVWRPAGADSGVGRFQGWFAAWQEERYGRPADDVCRAAQ